MFGIAPKLPIRRSLTDGYVLTKSLQETVLQNFKNLVLTCPGERMMDPLFGVGLRNLLFEQERDFLLEEVSSRISLQAATYLPGISVSDIRMSEVDENMTEIVYFEIDFFIIPLNINDTLKVRISLT